MNEMNVSFSMLYASTERRREVHTTNTRIKKLRKALDLTQQAFADRLGMKQNSIALIESGRKTSDQTIRAICREFHVNEEWLRTGVGEMFQPAPRDAIDELIEQYRLPREFRALTEKFIDLKPEYQEAVIEYMRNVAAALTAEEAATVNFPVSKPLVDAPPPWDEPAEPPVPPGYSSRAELEAEADEFAAMAREQFLSEKIPGYQAFFASESDGDLLA